MSKLFTTPRATLGALLVVFGWTRPAWAEPLGAPGTPITTSDYTIDLYEGPVLANTRVTGLGGAFVAIAQGVDGFSDNPAAAAYRSPAATSWFDYKGTVGVTFPTSLTEFDYDNNGDDSYSNSTAFFLTTGFGVQFGNLGFGGTGRMQRYHLGSKSDPSRQVSLSVWEGELLMAYSFLRGALITGFGVSAHNIRMEKPNPFASDSLLSQVAGGAIHMGVLLSPLDLPWRAGFSIRVGPPPTVALNGTSCRAPRCTQQDGNLISDGFFLPRTVTVPSELRFGIAVQMFRRMSFPWVNPHDAPSEARELEREVDKARYVRGLRHKRQLDEAATDADRARFEADIEAAEEEAQAEEERQLARASRRDRERLLKLYRSEPRERLLLSLAMRFTAPTTDGVGLESMLEQIVERSGERATLQPHVGLESEVIPHWVVARAGSYMEPSRFDGGSIRVHATTGLDVHVPVGWNMFGLLYDDDTFLLTGAVDGTARYFSWSVSVGVWR